MTNPGGGPPQPPFHNGPYHDRPYDPMAFQGMLEQIQMEAGMTYPHVIDRPTPEAHTPPHPAGYEDHPGLASQAGAALGGLRRIFTRDGREELADHFEDRQEDRHARIRHAADRMRDPRNTPINPYPDPADPTRPLIPGPGENPAAKVGWVGTERQYLPGNGQGSGGLGNLYNELLRKPAASGTRPTMPNPMRPRTRAEKAANRRLDAAEERRRKAADDAEWLRNSYGNSLHAGGPLQAPLSSGESRAMRKVSKQAKKLSRKAENANAEFERIANSDDWRGRLPW
jgi:hypothetical protein